MEYSMGIDPGTRNLGLAITGRDGVLAFSNVLDLKSEEYHGNSVKLVGQILERFEEYNIVDVSIERYVAYKGFSSDAEGITMLIGAIQYALSLAIGDSRIFMYRAIDWKPTLNKFLFKKGFKNPSKSFDKKFSDAAAEFICGDKPKTNHESDAICLSYMWNIK